MPPDSPAKMCAWMLLTVVAAGCSRATPKDSDPDIIIPVIAEPVQLGSIRATVSATGLVTTLPGADFAVTTPLPARIAEVTKSVGDHVNAGELLVRFEFPSLRAESAVRAATVKAAEQRVGNAKLLQGRVHGLVDRGAASRMEADEADREANEAEAELAEARASQHATESHGKADSIYAPFNGIVSERLHNPGDTVGTTSNEAILRIIDPRQVQVVATVGVADRTRFAVGASARVVAEGRSTPDLMRVVTRPEPDAGATTVPVTLSFESLTELAPGTQTAIEIDAEQRSNVQLVPAIAVVRDEKNEAAVFVALGDVAKRRPVLTGLVDAEHVEIRSGLKPGELVITQGLSNLRDGTPITVSPP